MAEKYLAGSGALWVQPDGENTEPLYLGCHTLGDVDEPLGDLTLLYCPDPAQPNKFQVKGSYRGEPGAITTSIETEMTRLVDYLETMQQREAVMYVNMVDSGRKDLFANRGRGFAFNKISTTSRGGTNWAVRSPDAQDEAMMTFDFGCEELFRLFPILATRKSTSETEAVTCIATYGLDEPCETIVAGCAAGAGVSANVLISLDGGVNFAATAADPHAVDEDIQAIAVFGLGADTVRILTVRESDAGAPCEAAYSDDDGATWTEISMGGTNAMQVEGPNGLFVLDPSHIWAVGTDGTVWFSSDAGASWSVQVADTVLTSEELMCVFFVDENYGFAGATTDELLRTADGGVTWELVAVAGVGDCSAVHGYDLDFIWLTSSDNGQLFYTSDRGDTITERTFPGAGTGSADDVKFVNELVGFLLHNPSTASDIYRTINGGYTWELVRAVTNSGIVDAAPCDANNIWMCGAVNAATGFLGKVSEQ